MNITISVTSEQLAVALNILSILLFISSSFFLCWIKKRVSENLARTFTYLLIMVFGIVIVKILVIFSDLYVISSFVYDSLLIVPAFFFFIAIVSFYRSIAKQVNKNPAHRVHHRTHHRRR